MNQKQNQSQKKRKTIKTFSKGNKLVIPRLLASAGGFPDHFRTMLTFSQTAVILLASAFPSEGVIFNLNAFITGALGLSQLVSVYNRFLVRKSSIKVQFANLSTTTPVRISITPINAELAGSLPVTTDDIFNDNPRSKQNTLSVLSGGTAARTLTNSCQVAHLLGLEELNTSSANAVGTTGSPNSLLALSLPSDIWYWYVSAQTLNGTNLITPGVVCGVTLFWDIEFYDRLPKY